MINDDVLWVEKYRPRKVNDTILPEKIKSIFQGFIDAGKLPNLLLTGSAGVGKTTIARALCDEMGMDTIIINGSMHGNIDTLRTEIKDFASSVSFSGNRKVVILDEADYLNPNSTQPALRNFMEEYSRNCGFILTCNMPNRIIPPLKSRCSEVNFLIEKKDAPVLAKQFFDRVAFILNSENVKYDEKAVAGLIKKYYPDWRKVLNEIQKYSISGQIDSGILSTLENDNINALVKFLHERKWTEMRKWVGESPDEPHVIRRKLYDKAYDLCKSDSIPTLVLLISKYDYQEGFVVDKEINFVAFLTEVMAEVEFK